MSTYRSEIRTTYGTNVTNRHYKKSYFNTLTPSMSCKTKRDFKYKYNPNDDLEYSNITDLSNNKDRFKILVSYVTNETTGLYVGEYTLIIDTVNKTAKEILDLYNTSQPRVKSHIDKIDVSLNDKGVNSINYHSKILNRDETRSKHQKPNGVRLT